MRTLRRYDAPILREIKCNNNNFEKSILHQAAVHWNGLEVKTRGITTANVI